jgi:glycosyltransferase involved in cell wall biosynthesis
LPEGQKILSFSQMNKIRILHLITELEPAGAENLLVNIVRKLDKRRFHSVVGYIYGAGTLAAEIKRTGVKVVDLSRKGKIYPWLIIKLFFLIRKEKIKIIHTHLVHASIVGRIAAKLAGVKAILTTRHYAYERKEETLIYWLERKTACFNEMTIAISSAVRNYLLNSEEYEPQKVVVIHNAIDLSLFDSYSGEPLLRTDENYLIGTVGRLHPQKGYDTLLRSMPHVIERFPQVKLMIVGDGFQRKYLEGFCSNLGISEQVIFLGRKAPAEVIGFLKNIDLFVLASNWEGFGIVVLEAMAEAKPVIATNVEGLPEVVEDGQTGFLVPPGQPIELANRIIELLNNRKLSKKMGIEGRKKVEAIFSLNSMISKLEGLYQKLEKEEQ